MTKCHRNGTWSQLSNDDVDMMRQHYQLQMLEKSPKLKIGSVLESSAVCFFPKWINVILHKRVCAHSVTFYQSLLPVNVVRYIDLTGWKLQNLFHCPNVLLCHWHQRNEFRGQACWRCVVDRRHVQFDGTWNQIQLHHVHDKRAVSKKRLF